MLIGNSHSRLSNYTRFKIVAGTLMAFAGESFTEDVEGQSPYHVVQIEVSIVSNGHGSDKYLAPFWPLCFFFLFVFQGV